MSTRSRIGYLFRSRDGRQKVISVYCHSDGYPSYVGRILKDHYSTPEKIVRLMMLGDISMLGTEPVDCPDLWDYQSPVYQAVNSLPDWNVCRTYKGRGDTDCGARLSNGVKDMVERLGEEYCYVFKDGRWYVAGLSGEDSVEYMEVGEAIEKEKAEVC